MRIRDILNEGLSQVPHKPENHAKDRKWSANYIGTALDAVYNILGDIVIGPGDDEEPTERSVVVSRSWTGYDCFSEMDSEPGMGGAIGLVNPNGSSPKDIATAAHEAFHALLQLNKKNFTNEHVVKSFGYKMVTRPF